METDTLSITIGARPISLSYFARPAPGEPVLYLHGLGCTKRDFTGAAEQDGLPGHALLAFDFPGCGESPNPPGEPLSVDDLVEIARAFLQARDVESATVVGHSMGGLTALKFAVRYPSMVRRLVSVEGNLAPEDCFFSRQALPYEYSEFERTFYTEFEQWLVAAGKQGYAWYAEHLRESAAAPAFYHYCRSIVAHSDTDPLTAEFIRLEIPRLLIYGSESAGLTYLATLAAAGVPLHEVPESSHFPAYSNPGDYYRAIREFLKST